MPLSKEAAKRKEQKRIESGYYKRRYEKKRDEIIARNKAYREANKEAYLEYQKAYRKAHPEKFREYSRQRYANLFGAEYDGWTDEQVWDRDGGICQLCFEIVPIDLVNHNDPMYPNIDHIVGITKGGTNKFDNVRLTHRKCNLGRTKLQETEGV
ncbi:MAG: HNH endonuclease [Actinobacteria bacterium]|nr:HNH endonuclease [Actinomycetota bacterium]